MEKPAFQEGVNKLLDDPYTGGVNAISVLQALVEIIGLDSLAAAVRTPLTGLKVAAYYGCIMEPARTEEDILTLEAKEKEHIAKVLNFYDNNRSLAAEALGICRKTLYRKIRQYDLF